MKKHRALVSAVTIGVLLVVLSSRARSDELREDVFMCEDAVARIAGCCPRFDPSSIQCVYSQGCSSTTTPQFSTDTARCVVHASCDDIAKGPVCGIGVRLCP